MNQLTGALCYRAKQFFRALMARVSEEEVEQAIHILTPEAQALFRRQAIQDQRHALEVYHTLRQAGHTSPQLLAAALLHDVGKAAARLFPWKRAVIVLLNHFAPRLLTRLSRGEPEDRAPSPATGSGQALSKGWRRAFIVHARHPEVGACWAQEAGCSPLTVALIRRHRDKLASCRTRTDEDQLLAALQAADNLS